MSSTLYICPEFCVTPLTLGEITEEMRIVAQRNKDWFEQSGLSLDFWPMTIGYQQYEKADLSLSLSLDKTYTWASPDVSPGAVLVELLNSFPLWDELEVYRLEKSLSYYYTIDLFGGGRSENQNLWRLLASAVANLVNGLTDFDAVWGSGELQTVKSNTVEELLMHSKASDKFA